MKFFVPFIALIVLTFAAPAIAATQVDINSADARTLAQSLDGVGLSKAEAIVAYRKRHGPFRTIEDFAKVEGIGPRKRAALLKYFGGLGGLKTASVLDIAKVDGISEALAERIYAGLHGTEAMEPDGTQG